jgi:hypothetical protein
MPRLDDIRRLTEQRKSLHAEMHKLNEPTIKENRSFSAEEQEQYDRMEKEFEDLLATEQRSTKLYLQDREVEKSIGTPIEKRLGDTATPRRPIASTRSSATASPGRTCRSSGTRSGTT